MFITSRAIGVRRVRSLPWRRHLRSAVVLDDYKGVRYPGRATFRLRWRDLDAMAHVNHATFLTYFEQARCELWGEVGLILDGKGEGPILKSVAADFKAPLKFPDAVTVGVRTVQLSPRDYEQQYACVSHASGRVVATGTARFVNFDYGAGRARDMSERMRRLLFGSPALEAPAAGKAEPDVCGDAKARILALGGTVSTERVHRTGGDEQHFYCVAELGGQRLSATASDEVALEQRVAAQLLDSVFSEAY